MEDPSVFRRYLLGELEESEQESLERKLMVSDEAFQELLIAEDELVDDQVAGRLSAREDRKYREYFLGTPERRRKHRFGEALRKHLSSVGAGELRKPFHRTWRLPAAAAAAALVAAGVWWILQTARSPLRLEQTAELGVTKVAFFLPGGNLRSLEPVQTFPVPAEVEVVELQLDLPAGARGDHEVTIADARTDSVLAEGTLPARSIEGEWVVVAAVPADRLTPGDYRVVLRAPSGDGSLAVVGTHEFRVTRP